MKYWVAIAIALAACITAATAQQFGPAQFNIKDDDGDPISNYSLNAAQAARIAALPGKIAVGNLAGDVTILQFYDLNCPFCREAAGDVDALVRADKNLKLVFVPYAVLSVASVQGAMIESPPARCCRPSNSSTSTAASMPPAG